MHAAGGNIGMDPIATIENGAGLLGGRRFLYPALPSTNRYCLDHLPTGCFQHGDVVWTERQTAGVGRFGRPWLSVPGQCLTFSVILEPGRMTQVPSEFPGQLAAVALRDMLNSYGIPALLKWPNDVYCCDAKIAGILIESRSDAPVRVLGIGLNVNLDASDFAGTPLTQPATSMRMLTGQRHDIRAALDRLLVSLSCVMENTSGAPDNVLTEWRRSDYLTGKRIVLQTPSGPVDGTYDGMDETGRLILQHDDGATSYHWAGDVTTAAADISRAK